VKLNSHPVCRRLGDLEEVVEAEEEEEEEEEVDEIGLCCVLFPP
jgi:hypothetical protein